MEVRKCENCKNFDECKVEWKDLDPVGCKDYERKEPEPDNVNHPSHYTSGAHECIDVMEAMFGTEAVINFCRCNIFKYRFRSNLKNGEEDIKKAEWYETRLMMLEEKVENHEAIHV